MTRDAVDSRSQNTEQSIEIAPDIAYLRDRMVNVYFVGARRSRDRRWALVDAGLTGSAARIIGAAGERFGHGERPGAIILTHGHFDHVGCARELADHWNVPIYAHPLELPYLTGRSSYPPPDPTVGGGTMTLAAWLYPRGPIDLRSRVRALPEDGAVPAMPGWRWLHTPGHTSGHVSLFRERDRALIAGDAFATTKIESMLAVLTQRRVVHGPPAYYPPGWEEASLSLRRLAALEPELGAAGHGVPMRGAALRDGLRRVADDFERLARPRRWRFVRASAPASAPADKGAVVDAPPAPPSTIPKLIAGAAIAGLTWAAARRFLRRGRFEK